MVKSCILTTHNEKAKLLKIFVLISYTTPSPDQIINRFDLNIYITAYSLKDPVQTWL